jgi:class 3 adenylate cyclase
MAMTERDELRHLLSERNEHPERLQEIDRLICDRFTRTLSVLVLDMSGFSRLTHRYGICHFLGMIHRMQQLVLPVVAGPRHAGRLLKLIADNVYAVFPDAPLALDAAIEVQRKLAIANQVLPSDWDVHVSIGIGHGDVLAVGDDEIYGHEMNLASKLGEDVGEGGDILLTEAAYARLPASERTAERLETTISHLTIGYYRIDAG